MGPIEIVAARPEARALRPACRRLLDGLRRATRRGDMGVTLMLASDAEIRRLNRRFRGLDRVTDVLSFPADGELEPGRRHLGDIAVSLPQAKRQARRAGWGLRQEISLLVTHGYLHLLGYDHERDHGEMHRLEARLLLRAGVRLDRRKQPWGTALPPGGPPPPPRGRRRR